MSQAFQYVKDTQGTPSPCLPTPAQALSVSLSAAASQPFTVPSNLGYTVFALLLEYGPNAEVWVSNGHTAAQPAGNSWATSNSILNPEGLKVSSGDVISFYNNGSSAVSVSASLLGVQ